MSIRKVNFVPGEFYHIYNRGNSKQRIFHDKQDHRHFVSLLYILNTNENRNVHDLKKYNDFDLYSVEVKDNLVDIGIYCLMPNHFHVLITERKDGGISKFMQKVLTAYVMYYNKKYERTGSLFEGKFKSEHASDDRYLKYLFSYIHLNPVKLIQKDWKENGLKNKKEALEFLSKYEYSSFSDYLGSFRSEGKILNKKSFPEYFPNDFPEYFPNEKSFISEIISWINYR